MSPWSPNPLHWVGPPAAHLLEATEIAQTATVDFSGLVAVPMLASHPPRAQPVLFTVLMDEQTAAPLRPPRRKPVSLLTVPSCELHF